LTQTVNNVESQPMSQLCWAAPRADSDEGAERVGRHQMGEGLNVTSPEPASPEPISTLSMIASGEVVSYECCNLDRLVVEDVMGGIGDHVNPTGWELAGTFGHLGIGSVVLPVEVEQLGRRVGEVLGEVWLLASSIAAQGPSESRWMVSQPQPKIGTTQCPLSKQRRLVPFLQEGDEVVIVNPQPTRVREPFKPTSKGIVACDARRASALILIAEVARGDDRPTNAPRIVRYVPQTKPCPHRVADEVDFGRLGGAFSNGVKCGEEVHRVVVGDRRLSVSRAVDEPDASVVGGHGADQGVHHGESVLSEAMETDEVAIGGTGLDPEGRYRGVKERM